MSRSLAQLLDVAAQLRQLGPFTLVSGRAGAGRVASTQLRSVTADTPESRAICTTLSELVRTSRTASDRNSGLYVGRRRLAIVDACAHCALNEGSTKTDQHHLLPSPFSLLPSTFFLLTSDPYLFH
jgi:hypothetical protein